MSNLTIVQDLYQAIRAQDFATCRQLWSEEIEWIQNPGFPNGGTWHGADAILENVFPRLVSTWKDFAIRIDELIEAPDRVIVLGAYTGTHHETGKTLNASFAHVYDLREGKIHRFRMFADTKTIWNAMT